MVTVPRKVELLSWILRIWRICVHDQDYWAKDKKDGQSVDHLKLFVEEAGEDNRCINSWNRVEGCDDPRVHSGIGSALQGLEEEDLGQDLEWDSGKESDEVGFV